MHYMRLVRHGDPHATSLNRPMKGRRCSICNEAHYAKGFCSRHYVRRKKHGDATFRLTRSGETITPDGYRRIWVDGVCIFEHRHVMQQFLGRTLTTNEVVHHKNGDTLDNRIANLEVMAPGDHSRHHHEQGDVYQRPCVYDQRPCLVCGRTPSRARSLCASHHSAWRRGYLPDLQVPPPLRALKNAIIK